MTVKRPVVHCYKITQQSVINDPPPSSSLVLDYYEVVRIPRGARQISVTELSSSDSYLALRNSKYMYYLTGGWTVDWPGNFKFGGTLFEYRRPYKKPEYLEAKGPTTEELIVEVIGNEGSLSICCLKLFSYFTVHQTMVFSHLHEIGCLLLQLMSSCCRNK